MVIDKNVHELHGKKTFSLACCKQDIQKSYFLHVNGGLPECPKILKCTKL